MIDTMSDTHLQNPIFKTRELTFSYCYTSDRLPFTLPVPSERLGVYPVVILEVPPGLVSSCRPDVPGEERPDIILHKSKETDDREGGRQPRLKTSFHSI